MKMDFKTLASGLTFAFFALSGVAYASHGNSNNGNSNSNAGGSDKITICHFPPGNPGNAHTITVGIAAWPTHQSQHGDTVGACATSTDNCYQCGYQVADFNAGGCAISCGFLQK